MPTGYQQAAFESVAGNETNTPTLSTKVIYQPFITFEPQLNGNPLERDDELRNVDEPIAVIPEAFDPSWQMETRAYPDLLGFELKACLGAPTTTAGNGIITDPDSVVIPTGAFRHVWTAPYSGTPTAVNPQTSQRIAAYSAESTFFKAKGCTTESLAITSPTTGGVRLVASGKALFLGRVADPSLTPAYEALTTVPFERSQLTLPTWLASSAVHEDFSLTIANPTATVRSMGIASKYPDVMEKDDPPVIVSGSLAQRHINAADWDALVANTGFAVKAKWLSTIAITGSYNYQAWFQALNAQYVGGGPDPLANTRTLGSTFDWKATYAGSAGSTTFTVVNSTTNYI